MSERVLISWNVPNLITVPLMAALGFLLMGVLVQLFRKLAGGKSAQMSAATDMPSEVI